jgi:polysaccharide biosynthesis transport protein
MSPVDPSNPVVPSRAPRLPGSGEPSPVPSPGHPDAFGPALVPPVLTALPSLGALWQALCRRWLLALGLALAGAAVVGYVLWQLIPAPYVSELRLQLRRPPAYMPGSADSGYDDFMRGQAALFKTSRVLTAALRDDKVRGLSVVRNHPDALDWLTKDLTVKFLSGDNYLLIKLAGEDPEELAAVITALVESYKDALREERKTQEQRLDEARKSIEAQVGALDKGSSPPDTKQLEQARISLARVKDELRLAEADLIARERERPALREKDLKPDDPRVRDAVDEMVRQEPRANEQLKRIDDINRLIDETIRVSSLKTADPDLPPLYEARKKCEERLADMRKELIGKAASQLVQKVNAGRDLLLAPTRGSVASLRRQVEILNREVAELQSKDTPDARALAARVKALEEARIKNFSDLNKIVLDGDDVPWVTPMGQPTVPKDRDRDKQIKFAGLGAFSVFGVLLFAVALVEFRTRRVTSSDEITQGLGIPTVGTIPALPVRARRGALTGNAQSSAGWQALLTESVDALRTLLFRALGEGSHVVLVTSAVPGEGKTSLASQLAASLARAWRKTLLVDGDLRKPAAHQLFELPVEPGLSEVLRGDLEAGEVIRPTSIGRLWMMPAGRWDTHALQALAQEGVANLFEQLKEEYEFIIVDSCPVLPVTDTLLLGQHADTVLFSVLRGTSLLPSVYAARQRLAALDIPVLGAVVVGGSSTFGGLDIQYPRPAAS